MNQQAGASGSRAGVVRIECEDAKVYVTVPFNPLFNDKARELGGRFQNGRWAFDVFHEETVRAACMRYFGSDGVTVDTCTVRVTLTPDDDAHTDSIRVLGRPVARATGRDSGASICDGVVPVSGRFSSGGSVKNWATVVETDQAIVLIRDFPRATAERMIAKQQRVMVIEPEPVLSPNPEKEALLAAERKQLLARLAEIDRQLASTPAQAGAAA